MFTECIVSLGFCEVPTLDAWSFASNALVPSLTFQCRLQVPVGSRLVDLSELVWRSQGSDVLGVSLRCGTQVVCLGGLTTSPAVFGPDGCNLMIKMRSDG